MTSIAVAGTVLVDHINSIRSYPSQGELVRIEGVKKAVGGCVPNVAADLKILSPALDVCAIGRIGRDADGALVKETLRGYGVNVDLIAESETEPTGFTEVMSVTHGERTFFSCPGANAGFGAEDVDFELFRAERLHLGYFFLLDKIDRGDGLKLLREAKRRGIRTSIDLVSDSMGDADAVKACLPYVDDLIVNELEAAMLADRKPTDDLGETAACLKRMGISGRVIIHRPASSLCLSARGTTVLPSFRLPEGYIKGATGAGDAFTAGALIGIGMGLSDEAILDLASSAAVAALSAEDAVSGMKRIDELQKALKNFGRQ